MKPCLAEDELDIDKRQSSRPAALRVTICEPGGKGVVASSGTRAAVELTIQDLHVLINVSNKEGGSVQGC